MTHVAVLPGDGIGPEVAAEAIRVLDALGIEHSEHPFGGNAILDQGTPLPDETLAACRESDAVLLAAVGLPEARGKPVRPEQGLLGIRKELGVYANLRPALADGIDLLIVRELVGGLYFGAKGTRDDGTWFDTCEYSRPEVERIARARSSSRATRRAGDVRGQGQRHSTLTALEGRRHGARRVRVPGRAARPRARRLLRDDHRAGAGDDRRRAHREHVRRHPLRHRRRRDRGLGLAASASLGDEGPGLYEPVHGSAPQIAGQGSPTRRRCSARRRSCCGTLDREAEADALERAVDAASRGADADLGGAADARELGDAVLRSLAVTYLRPHGERPHTPSFAFSFAFRG